MISTLARSARLFCLILDKILDILSYCGPFEVKPFLVFSTKDKAMVCYRSQKDQGRQNIVFIYIFFFHFILNIILSSCHIFL